MESFPAHLKSKESLGYTMIELMMVMAIMAFLGAIGFFGFRDYERSAQLRNAQRELISRLLVARNEALSGVLLAGRPTHYAFLESDPTGTYIVDGNSYQFDSVFISSIDVGPVVLCFFHFSQEVPADPADAGCINNCVSFACDSGGTAVGGSVTITLEHRVTGATNQVIIEGQDLRVNRIYEGS